MRISWEFTDVKHAKNTIIPVFLPFIGCPQQCVYCAQYVQSGTRVRGITDILYETTQILDKRQRRGLPPVELAFYGGTFTALPAEKRDLCLNMAKEQLAMGTVCALRCSTRPDAVSEVILHQLAAAGFTTIELGVQSFNSDALQQTQRGYAGALAQEACRMVRSVGLRLGVQLLAGMPGVSPEVFVDDVRISLQCDAQMLRFYPCVVFKDTVLAQWWCEGRFQPWDLQTTVEALAEGLLLAQEARVPVIRMGLAPQAGMDAHILAGVRHPSLGSVVQGQALFWAVERCLAGQNVATIFVPRFCQGFFWGQAGSLRKHWHRLGVREDTLVWTDGSFVFIDIDSK